VRINPPSTGADNRAPETQPREKSPELAPPPTPEPAPATSGPNQPAALLIDLPNALRLVNTSSPTIALARERVQEAYARLRQAQVLWLPTLQTGPAYTHHDGVLQTSRGELVKVSKSSFFEGGGAALSVHSSDALFGPLIARQLVEAQIAASRAVRDQVQLDAALTYLDLLRVYGALAISADTLDRVNYMARSAESAAKNNISKTGADINRARAELHVRLEERIELEGEAAAVSARLAQILFLEPTVDLRPADLAILPITLVPIDGVALEDLVATGLMNRPELAESRSLVAAALARWRQARVSPLLPRLEASYLAGTFGGGTNFVPGSDPDRLANFAGRDDLTAQAIWELPGLGAGYIAQTRVQRSLYNQANIHVAEVEAQVAAEVTAAAKVALSRRRALADAQGAVRQAEIMWDKLKKASFGVALEGGKFDPLEPLLAEQALAQARQLYLTQVIEYDKAQFRLYRAMGQPPMAALPKSAAIPVDVPAAPGGLGPDYQSMPKVNGEQK
jgi:outer membrane protein TolC